LAQAKLEAFLERLQKARSTEDLQGAVEELREIYGVAHIIYHTVNQSGEQIGALTYDEEWVRHYLDRDYKSIDPTVAHSVRRFDPADWKQLDWSSRRARSFLREAVDAGVGNQGYTIPIWGPRGELAVLTVNHRATDGEWQRFIEENGRDFLLLSHFIHQQAKLIQQGQVDAPRLELSPREREVLSLLSLGRSRAAVADSLRISENTLRAYIDSARHKLGALNSTHAVALALARGVIRP
jgi:DNA-binding CsgD family transcriptional regulator